MLLNNKDQSDQLYITSTPICAQVSQILQVGGLRAPKKSHGFPLNRAETGNHFLKKPGLKG